MKRRHHLLMAAVAAAIILITPPWAFSADSNQTPGGGPPGAMGAPDGGMPPQGGMPDGSGGPGGPGGPGGDPNIGAEAMRSEPVISAAESQLADYDAVKNKEAVTAIFDFGLMEGVAGKDKKLFFRPEEAITFFDLAKAIAGATQLIGGDTPDDPVSYCVKKGLLNKASAPDESAAGYDAARMLLSALGVKGVSGGGDSAVDKALKGYDLTKGIDGLDLSKTLSRDNAAQLIANALSLSDGTGLIPKVLHNTPVQVGSGAKTINNTRIFYNGGSAVQNSGESVLVVRNSRIDGDTSVTTEPLSGNPGGLLVGGSIRTTLTLGQSQAFYINSEVNSKDWAALSTDGATMVTEPGQKELSLYTYGGTARTIEGGYGTYSDLFCNVYLYGTKLDSAEIGIISGTYGAVTVGTIGDGEADKSVAKQLTAADKKIQKNKRAGSVITGGRNAIMIHSVNLPPYWANEGYSKEEIPLHSGKISVHGSMLATDLAIDKKLAYPAERQAYIDYHAGSVIAVKSSNADIVLDQVTMKADSKGSGALIHTLINNDSKWMITVPDGETYPGVKVAMTDMKVEGNILHEDYQRDMYLSLADTTLTGSITSGTVAQWNALCKEKGFESYIIDPDGYKTVHGVHLTLASGSAWKVTGKSTLIALTIEKGADITSASGKPLRMMVDGIEKAVKPGEYRGSIEISVK